MDAIKKFFDSVVTDLTNQSDRVKASFFRSEVDEVGGRLFAPDWFKYFSTGRGPGGMPPVENILMWAEKYITQPVRENKDGTFSIISYESAAYGIAINIGKFGTQVWQGKKQGIDFLGAMEKNMPEMLKGIGESEVLRIATSLQSAIK